jgi:hypothetical protein
VNDAVGVRQQQSSKCPHVAWTADDNRTAPVKRQQFGPVELKFQTLLKAEGGEREGGERRSDLVLDEYECCRRVKFVS